MNQKLVVHAVSNGAFGEVIDDGTGGLLAAIARSIWAIPGGMGRHDNATFSPSLSVLKRGEKRMVCVRWLLRQNIEPGSSDAVRFQGFGDGVYIDDFAPRCVDEDGVFFHTGERLAVDHAACLFRQRCVQSDDIGFPQQLLQTLTAFKADRLIAAIGDIGVEDCLLYTSPSPRDS